ncbi:spindle assembly abnormal protein 6 homolog isoform X1 [Alligator mississippiensis]|uniref:Spindle assembly abnormal protein 6 homolog n=1 Tax=Alligator mississippiensis TaxID=8496 RepID=A0A151M4T9_ALLMI|nr:spindle assembly abnormal protein 6 homolog isoform X1 [Alligator mississippiensis]KYO19539.1 spindle assembly abnormal 6-like protein isoform B [Alligator mississippiensis]
MAAERLFERAVRLQLQGSGCEERRMYVRVSIELQSTSTPIHKRDLVVQLTDDTDPFFLYNLVISEEDFQSLKFQQGLLVDFSAFPQRFIDLLQQCIQEQNKDIPRFLLQLVSSASALDHKPVFLNVVETNPFKHLTHLSLQFLPGNDAEIKKFLANCLKCIKEEKLLLEQKLKKTEDDLTRQLNFTQQSLSEKSRELDKLRSEWTSHTAALTNKHAQELTNEKEKALQAQTQCQQQHEQQKKELESIHQRSIQQLQNRLSELEIINKDLTERRYKGDSTVRELKGKLSGIEDECQRTKQEVLSLRRENTTLDAECHEKEKLINQLQTRVAVLEQEIKDKDQLVNRTKEVLNATQEQKVILEENTEKKQIHIGKLEATIKSLSAELLKANEIIKKLQGDLKTLMSKLKLKNTVTIQQEKLLAEKEEKLQKERRDLQETGQSLRTKEQEICKLQEQLESTVQKLEESKQLLKTNENVITWLNKQLNEIQMARKQEVLGTSTISPVLPSNSRIGISPQNMLENRFPPPSLGINYPISPIYTLQTVPEHTSARNASQQFSGPKIQFNTQLSKTNRCSDVQMVPVATSNSANKENGEHLGLELKYLKKREDSIPLRGLSQNTLNSSEYPKSYPSTKIQTSSKPVVPSTASAYFPG